MKPKETENPHETQIWNTIHQWCNEQACEIPDFNRRALMDRVLKLMPHNAGKPSINKIPMHDLPHSVWENLLLGETIDLKPYCGKEVIARTNQTIISLIKACEGQKWVIHFDIPTYQINHPEKLEATKSSMYIWFEYTKREAYTTTEIDMYKLKSTFFDRLEKLLNHTK